MKRYISLFLSLLLVFLITGCQDQRAEVPSTQEQATQETTKPEASEPTEPDAQETTQPEAAEPDPQPENQQTEQQTTQQETDVTEDPVVNETSDKAISEGEATEAEKEDDQAALIGHLDDICENIHVGTAGSSLTAAQQAANLLDWGMETVLNDNEIQAAVQDWYAAIDSADQEEVQMQFSGVAGAVEQVTGEDGAGLLDSAGCTDSSYPWNDTAKAAVQVVLSAIPEAE